MIKISEIRKLDEGKDYRLLAQRHTMNLSKQAIVTLVADLYKKLDKLNALESVEEFEGEELSEAWNEKLSIKALGEYRKVYEMMKKSGVDKRFIASMEKFYDDLAIGGMFTSRGAEEKGILKIDGKTKYKNANW